MAASRATDNEYKRTLVGVQNSLKDITCQFRDCDKLKNSFAKERQNTNTVVYKRIMQKHSKQQAVTAQGQESQSKSSVQDLMALNKNCRGAGYAHDYMRKLRDVCKGDVKSNKDVVESATVPKLEWVKEYSPPRQTHS